MSGAATLRGLFDAFGLLREFEQVALAEAYARDPRLLRTRVRNTMAWVEARQATDEPFRPQPRKPLSRVSTIDAATTTHDFVSYVAPAGPGMEMTDPRLGFRFVDYEIFPLRTTGSDRVEPRRLDLLLANAVDGTPIFAEVKIGGDKNVFYALVQALALAVEFGSAAQRDRLRLHYGNLLRVPKTGPVGDVYILSVGSPEDGAFRGRLRSAAEATTAMLAASSDIRSIVRRIVLLEDPKVEPCRLTPGFACSSDGSLLPDQPTSSSGSSPQ